MGNFLKDLKDVGIGRETAFGIVGTISEWVGAKKADFNLLVPNKDVPEVTGRREVFRTYVSADAINPSMGFDIDPEGGLGVVLRSFFGTVADSAAQGTFATKHVFSFRAGADSDSMFARYTQAGTIMKNYVGVVPQKLMINYAKDSNVEMDVSFVGQDEKVGTNVGGTHGTLNPFLTSSDINVLLGGVASADVANFKVDIENGAKAIFTLGTLNACSRIVYGGVTVKGSFDILGEKETRVGQEILLLFRGHSVTEFSHGNRVTGIDGAVIDSPQKTSWLAPPAGQDPTPRPG